MPATKKEAMDALLAIEAFLPVSEFLVLARHCVKGEEQQYFRDKVVELAKLIATMPKTYEQDGKGDQAVAYLHYFSPSGDWYITEKDQDEEQHQAFGLANMGEPELGYISIVELVKYGVELDLHWTPKTLAEVKKEKGW